MKNHHFRYLIFICILLGLGACVSVQIPTGAGSPAKDVKYAKPTSPFDEIEVPSGDKAWLSQKTGNTISFLSDCKSSADPGLQQIEGESLAVFDKLKILQTKKFEFNGRDAQRTQAQGEIDGIAVKTELVTFKKNGCNFTLSYGGVAKTFESELSHFETFLESFKAP